MINSRSWEEIKDSLKIGTKLNGTVTKHFPFGIFVNILGVKFTGLIQITDFKDQGYMTPLEYPPVGSTVNVVVLGLKESGQQIWLGMKPSQLSQSQEFGVES
jgi:ribosomal protein S1